MDRFTYSIIIPTLNEQENIPRQAAAIGGLSGSSSSEVIVADGESNDRTVEAAQKLGWVVVTSKPGRGEQMNRGAKAATGEVLLFLHADTILPVDALQLIEQALQDQQVKGGNFKLAFAGKSSAARWLTRLYPLLRFGGMCYGDSCLFVRRQVYDKVGGFRDYPIFEDCDIYQRLRRAGRFQTVDGIAITSSRRFEGRFFRTFILWAVLQTLYWLGAPPRWLGRFYKVCR
ncbi:MAG: glycosyltransferase [Acidobacteria bacterium]|nr:glycosyltransferase [Acidobacteriota bacterium]